MYVGVTDRGWVQHLGRQAPLEEVNFWQPSARSFKALPVGGLFLFKLHHPWNMVVGGGFFARHLVLPVDLAWDTFEETNGAASLTAARPLLNWSPSSRRDFARSVFPGQLAYDAG